MRGLPWFFTSSGTKPLTNLAQPKAQLDEASGATGWVLHDLRDALSAGDKA